jgi:hypothetical protein
LRDAEHLLLRITLEKVEVLHQRGGTTARRGDAPAAIAFAMALLPIAQVTLKVDLAMSTVLLAALGGDAAAAVILARILRKVDLDHSSAIELADSWGRFSRRCSAIRPSHPVTANRLTSRGRGARAGTPSAGVFA